MMRSLYVAATGMTAQETKLDTIANNLANSNTAGFKRQDAEFEDLMYQEMRTPARLADGGMGPTGVQIGLGSRVVATPRSFSQGAIQQTGNPLDLAIEGDGFFTVTQSDGTTGYTRAGQFKLDADGRMLTSSGLALDPPVTIPAGVKSVTIGADGIVMVATANSTDPVQVGQIQTALFSNPSGLESRGHNVYQQSASSGEPQLGTPSEDGHGGILQGAIEGSNVEVVTEMIAMIRTQRAYEINSKVVSAADDMLRNATTMR